MHNVSKRELRIGLAELQSRQAFTNAQQFGPVSVTRIPLLQNELGTFPFRRIIAIEPVGLNQREQKAGGESCLVVVFLRGKAIARAINVWSYLCNPIDTIN